MLNLFRKSRIININKYRSIYINIKNFIVFTFLKMKKAYNLRYQTRFFRKEDLINL